MYKFCYNYVHRRSFTGVTNECQKSTFSPLINAAYSFGYGSLYLSQKTTTAMSQHKGAERGKIKSRRLRGGTFHLFTFHLSDLNILFSFIDQNAFDE